MTHAIDRDGTARRTRLAVLLCAIGIVDGAGAASFQVAPLRLMFEPDQRAVSITLSNGGDKPVVVEARAFTWEQVDGADKLTPSTELVLSPPLIEVPAKSSQVIRVGRRATVKAGALERTYRLMLQEVVPAAESAKPGLHFALRLSIPVFIAPLANDQALARPRPSWSLGAGPKGELAVAVRNEGNIRMQISELEVLGADDKVRASQAEMSYVLAGQSRRLLLNPVGALPTPGTLLTLKAKTDAGDQVARVAFAKP